METGTECKDESAGTRCYLLARLICRKLMDFQIDASEHEYKTEWTDACENAKDPLKEALARLMMTDGNTDKEKINAEIEGKIDDYLTGKASLH